MKPTPSLLRPAPGARGFTLTELLVVVAVMVVVGTLSVTAFKSMGQASGFTSAAYDIAGILERARAEAMRRNTYVYVGVAEVDNLQSGPATGTRATVGAGRVVVGVIASNDGTSQYDPNASSVWNYGTGTAFYPVVRVQILQGVHLVDLRSVTGGAMARPAVTLDKYALATAGSQSDTTFTWPVGSSLSAGQYLFNKVIQFGPQGSARMVSAGTGLAYPQFMEIGLQPTHGNAIPATPSPSNPKNVAAVQIAGVTGAVEVYRP